MRNPLKHHTLTRTVLIPLGAAMLLAMAIRNADAAVEVTIDKDTQTMTVAVDGAHKWTWPVSTGVPSHETPNGTFRAFRMEADHFSKEWDDAPMPHSIFFTKIGHAIHGTEAERHLGMPASHGCVRLSRENAAKLYALVEKEGVLNTTVTLTGSSRVALARGRQGIDVANADPRATPQQPLGLTPRAGQYDDTSADSTDDLNAPPRGYQPNAYGNQGYQQQPAPPPGYYNRNGYGGGYVQGYPQQGYSQPQGYAPQPYRPQGYAYSQPPQGYAPQPPQGYPNYPGYARGPADYSYYGN